MLLANVHKESITAGAFRVSKPTESKCLIIKLVLFVDHKLDSHLKQNLRLNKTQIGVLMQSYVNQIESIFSSLRNNQIKGIKFDLVDVRIEKMAGNFTDGQLNGDIDVALSKFCLYQASELRRCTNA